MESRSKVLNSGHKMPSIGFGTWLIPEEQALEVVTNAIDSGYRLIDCAYMYGNEKAVGVALTLSISTGKVKREDLFITSKVWNSFHSRSKVVECVEASLKALNLNYLDLCLIHWPMGYKEGGEKIPKDENGKSLYSNVDYLETWQGLEDLVFAHKLKSIGISNFNQSQILRISENSKIKPAVLQLELHPYFPQNEIVEFCTKHGITVSCHSPLANGKNIFRKPNDPILFDEPILKQIADEHKKTIAQIILRWHVQRGLMPIPKAVQKAHMVENTQIWDFALTEKNMADIALLDRNYRITKLDRDIAHPFYPF